VFALLVDNISKMSISEQKLLWIELNKCKIGELAKEIDSETVKNSLTEEEVVSLVKKKLVSMAVRKRKVKRFVIDVNTYITVFINRETHWLQDYIIRNSLEVFIDNNLLEEISRVLTIPT
jgi:hypothetical protein